MTPPEGARSSARCGGCAALARDEAALGRRFAGRPETLALLEATRDIDGW